MRLRTLLSVLVVGLAATRPSAALEALPVSLADAVRRADVIVHGRVVAREVRWNPQQTLPITIVHVLVDEALKGATDGTVRLEMAGGEIDGRSYRISDLPLPAIGSSIVAFVYTGRPPGISPIVGANQWYFVLEPDPEVVGEQRVVDAHGGIVVGWRDGRPLAVDPRRVRPGAGAADADVTGPKRVEPTGTFDATGAPRPRARVRAQRPTPLRMTWSAFRAATLDAIAAEGQP